MFTFFTLIELFAVNFAVFHDFFRVTIFASHVSHRYTISYSWYMQLVVYPQDTQNINMRNVIPECLWRCYTSCITILMDIVAKHLQYKGESVKINTPTTILSNEEVKAIKPSERETYVRNLIKSILRLNENGVMVSEIVEATNLNRITVTKHLEYLVAIREAYKKDRGIGAVYYLNGRLVHPTDRLSINFGNRIYEFVKLENSEGEFVFIQEKEQDWLRVTTVRGGIMLSCSDLPEFLSGLQKFMVIAEQNKGAEKGGY